MLSGISGNADTQLAVSTSALKKSMDVFKYLILQYKTL